MKVLTAIMQAVPGTGDDVEREFKRLTPKVLKDPGAVIHIVNRAVDDPDKFLVYEQYENDDAFKYHVQTEHYQAFRQATKSMFIGKTAVTFYNKVA
jgi:quinol monooxygenase YgiN